MNKKLTVLLLSLLTVSAASHSVFARIEKNEQIEAVSKDADKELAKAGVPEQKVSPTAYLKVQNPANKKLMSLLTLLVDRQNDLMTLVEALVFTHNANELRKELLAVDEQLQSTPSGSGSAGDGKKATQFYTNHADRITDIGSQMPKFLDRMSIVPQSFIEEALELSKLIDTEDYKKTGEKPFMLEVFGLNPNDQRDRLQKILEDPVELKKLLHQVSAVNEVLLASLQPSLKKAMGPHMKARLAKKSSDAAEGDKRGPKASTEEPMTRGTIRRVSPREIDPAH